MKLFCAMLISLKDTPFGSLSKERLLEWRWVVQDLMEAKFNILFLLEYFRSVAHAFFQRKVTKDLDAEIAAAKEALAHAHKVLQDLKTRKQQILSSLATSSTPAVPQEGFLLASLMPQIFFIFFYFLSFCSSGYAFLLVMYELLNFPFFVDM